MEAVKTLVGLSFLPLIYCALGYMTEVRTKSYADSPDGHYTAAVREHIDPSVFATPEMYVTLRSNERRIPLTRGEKVLIIKEAATDQPQLEWRSPDELVVKLTRKPITVPYEALIGKQMMQYKDVKITYEIASPLPPAAPQPVRNLNNGSAVSRPALPSGHAGI